MVDRASMYYFLDTQKHPAEEMFFAQSTYAPGGPNRVVEAARMLRPARLNRTKPTSQYISLVLEL